AGRRRVACGGAARAAGSRLPALHRRRALRRGGQGMNNGTVSVIGCVQMDLVMTPVSELPPSGATRFVDSLGMRPGGAGANAALALTEVGITPRLAGALGDDELGRWLLADMEAAGVGAELIVLVGGATRMTAAAGAPGRDRS